MNKNVKSSKNSKNSKNTKPATKKVEAAKTVKVENKPVIEKIEVTKSSIKTKKKLSKWVIGLYILSALLIFVGILFNNALAETVVGTTTWLDYAIPVKFIGIVLLGIAGVASVIDSENSLIKSLMVVLFVTMFATWLFPQGSISGANFVEVEGTGVNLNDIIGIVYTGIYNTLDKIVALLVIAMFYKVAAKTGVYKEVVKSKAKMFKKKETLFAVGASVSIVVLTSVMNQMYMVIFFIPFVISILSELKVDKLTAFAVTFGSLIAGTIASPYGTEGLKWFNYYASVSLSEGLNYRFILQACILVLLSLFIFLKLKVNDNKEEVIEDYFLDAETNKKANPMPLKVVMLVTSIMLVIGFINWSFNFEILIFDEFHEWLFNLTLGETKIFELFLGDFASARAIGSWELFDGCLIISLSTLLLILSYRLKFSDMLDLLTDTAKELTKPFIVLILVTCIFAVGYMTQYLASVGQYFLDLNADYNPFAGIVVAAASTIAHNDLGFTAYMFSAFFAERFGNCMDIVGLTFTSISGIIQLIVPTSPILIGLYYTKVSYKSWLKYISVFTLGIFVIAVILITVTTYLV